ncbi:flagellar basal-body rod protein FlgG [bacterium]|jgi:flagellar basal-body rod protein FlgG|nr:flagellar basal-body rod protein FlgG [Armatimonadetes bacterium Uphvl-Ar1]MBA4291870.1 flagellar basal-body rod protein FlgG [bacterium]
MMRALNTAGTGMVSQQMNLDVIANNLANVNTTAFKSQRAEFQDLMYQNMRASGAATGGDTRLPQSSQIGLGSRFSASATNFVMGSLLATGGVTDVAINGGGFFQIQMPGGETAYTRDGSFKTDANGLIVTSDGYQLIPNMTVPPGARALTISPEGFVSAILPGNNDPTELGQIQLATFTNAAGLTRAGQNLYLAGGASGEPQIVTPGQEGTGTLQQNFLEGSNVQIVEEMVKMITAQRAYEINSKAIQTSDDMLSILNNLKR